MPFYAYVARSRSGEKVEGVVEAAEKHFALMQIERMGYVPVSVKEKAEAEAAAARTKKRRFFSLNLGARSRMNSRELTLFTTELADLLSSGMKLGNALNTLSHRRTRGPADVIISELRDEIIRGASLSDALSRQGRSFPALYVSLVRAGEAGGALSEVLQRLVNHLERMQDVREKVIMALVYPCIVLGAGFATLIFSMAFVVPRFKMIFVELGSTLPLPTQILIAISDAMVKYGWLIAVVLAIAIVAFRGFIRAGNGKLWWHGAQLRMPLVRGIITAGAFAQFARTLGMLIANGVPVLEALKIVERVMTNTVMAREIQNARERVTDGTTISSPLAAGKIFPPILTDMLAVGEETGDMAGALSHIARRYENELDRSVKIFTTALEPILIVLMALMVGFVAISILLAVFDLTSGLHT